MAASTLAHASSVLVWGSAAILKGLPEIFGRGGDEALEGPGSVKVVLLSALGSGATLAPAEVAGVAEGAPGAPVVLAVVGAAGAVPVVSGVPPALGGSVVRGAGVAPAVDGASTDARFSSSPAARSGIAGVAMGVGPGLSVVWLVFLFLFFSSFFSSASLGRRRVMRYGVDTFSLSSCESQEEGMMNIAARFSLSKKPRFIDPKGKKPND
jgi:hypothetical protein